jgi:hypothetical protein
MSYKNHCSGCLGTYPLDKHDFDKCCSVDLDWDLLQMSWDSEIVLIQSLVRGSIIRLKMRQGDGVKAINKLDIDTMLTSHNMSNLFNEQCNIRFKLEHKHIRGLNFPSQISENIVRLAIDRKYKTIKCSWDIEVGDLEIRIPNNYIKIEVKAFSSSGPSSFGPTEQWDKIYFIDCTNGKYKMFKIYEINLTNSSKKWSGIMLSKTETFKSQCDAKRRPRICFDKLLPQIQKRDYNIIFDGCLDDL